MVWQREADVGEIFLGAFDDAGQVVEDALHGGVFVQDGFEDGAVAAADIDERVDAGVIVGVDHCLRFRAVEAGHGGVKDLRRLGMFGEKIENGFAEDVIEGGLAGLHAVEQIAPGAVVLFPHHHGDGLLRAGLVEQALGHRRHAEFAVGRLAEDFNAGEGPQQPIQRLRMHLGRGRKLGGGLRARL